MKDILKKLGFYEFDGAYRIDFENNNKLILDFECFNIKRDLYEIKTLITVYPKHSKKIIMHHGYFEGTYHCVGVDFEGVITEIIENSKKIHLFFEG